MSIQDDIFDVEAALDDKPEALAAFERVKTYFFALEAADDRRRDLIEKIARGVGAAQVILDEFAKEAKRG